MDRQRSEREREPLVRRERSGLTNELVMGNDGRVGGASNEESARQACRFDRLVRGGHVLLALGGEYTNERERERARTARGKDRGEVKEEQKERQRRVHVTGEDEYRVARETNRS